MPIVQVSDMDHPKNNYSIEDTSGDGKFDAADSLIPTDQFGSPMEREISEAERTQIYLDANRWLKNAKSSLSYSVKWVAADGWTSLKIKEEPFFLDTLPSELKKKTALNKDPLTGQWKYLRIPFFFSSIFTCEQYVRAANKKVECNVLGFREWDPPRPDTLVSYYVTRESDHAKKAGPVWRRFDQFLGKQYPNK